MSNLNSTVSGAVLTNSLDPVSLPPAAPAASEDSTVNKASDGKDSSAPELKIRTLSSIVLRDALRAVKNNEESNWDLVTSVVAMTVDALSRNVHDKLEIGTNPKPDARRQVPSMVTSTHSKVMRELKVKMVLAGRSPFSNASEGVARILALPRDTLQQRNIRRAQAEKLVDAALFHNGFPVPPFKGKHIPAEFQGAEPKANNESMKLANKYSGFIVDWFWNNNRELLNEFAFRVAADHKEGDATPFIALTAADLETIRNHIRETFGENMTQLEASYRVGKPARAERSKMESLQNAFNKLDFDQMQAFLRWAQSRSAEVVRENANVRAATEGAAAAEDADIDDAIEEFAVKAA